MLMNKKKSVKVSEEDEDKKEEGQELGADALMQLLGAGGGPESRSIMLQGNLEESLEENIKSISIKEDSDNFTNLTVTELRKLVSSKKLVSNSKNLKKHELLELLTKK